MGTVQKKPATLCTSETWIGRADCAHCAIRGNVLFSDLPKATLEEILTPINIYCYPRENVVYHEGDQAPWVYTIRKGIVKLVRYLADGTPRIVRILKIGDAFGFECMVDQTYEHTAIAIKTTEVCRIPISVITHLDDTNHELHTNLIKRWEEHLQYADNFIALLSTGSLRRRVAALIDMLSDLTMNGDRKHAELFCRDDLAAMVGVRTESVSRIIAELKREHILELLENDVYHYDREALQHYATNG
jgi:CRP-like cAMP-binding protein